MIGGIATRAQFELPSVREAGLVCYFHRLWITVDRVPVGEMGEHRPLGNTVHPNIRKSIQPNEIAECSQVALYHRKPIWKVNVSMHC